MITLSTCETVAIVLLGVALLFFFIGAPISHITSKVGGTLIFFGVFCWLASLILMFFVPDGQFNLFDWIGSLFTNYAFDMTPILMGVIWIFVLIAPLSVINIGS